QRAQLGRVQNARLAAAATPEDRARILLGQAMQSRRLDAAPLGKNVADEIKKGSGAGVRIAEWVLGHASPDDRLAFANEVMQNLDDRKLKDLTKTAAGDSLLKHMHDALKLTHGYGMKHSQALRIDAITRAAPRPDLDPRAAKWVQMTEGFLDLVE